MSAVSNVILAFACGDEDQITAVNAFFDAPGRNCGFGDTLNSHDSLAIGGALYGGGKHLECNLAIAAFNYFELDEFKAHLATIEWEFPEDVALFNSSSDRNEPWTLWRLEGGK